MTILCIDDDPEDIEFFSDAINAIGDHYSCVFASDGFEGLRILSDLTPDFIFLDINMPLMSGKEALPIIRSIERLKTVPICVLSTVVNPYESEMLKNLGATYCLKKATTLSSLRDSLRKIFTNKIDFTTHVSR
jgi:CheY-like chemotaxis protein